MATIVDKVVTMDGTPVVEQAANERVINGKKVVLHNRIPGRELRSLPKLLRQIQGEDLYEQLPLCKLLIESWEAPGSPMDDEAYGDLDGFRELLPVQKFVAEYALGFIQVSQEQAKN